MIHRSQNWSFEQPPLNDNDVIDRCNCSQKYPSTEIATGKTGLKFIDSNLVNCSLPPDAQIDECNATQIDFCYWLNPDLDLPVEPENCRHVVEIDTIVIDGETQTVYEREDTVL